MSWLSNVNNLLTKLDDEAGVLVEERTFDGTSDGVGIDQILAKRGLLSMNDGGGDDDDVEEEENVGDEESNEKGPSSAKGKAEEINTADTEADPQPSLETKSSEANESTTVGDEPTTKEDAESHDQNENRGSAKEGSEPTWEAEPGSGGVGSLNEDGAADIAETKKDKDGNIETTSAKPSLSSESQNEATHPSLPEQRVSTTSKEIQASGEISSLKIFGQRQNQQVTSNHPKRETMQAQKEVRILRRHVVSLNEQLETAESELQAQRKELERAGERMEKDRAQQKIEKDSLQKRTKEEIELMKKQNEKSLKEQQARFEEQLERYRKKLSEEENRRKQQGGDWDKEMSNAIDREQEMQKTLDALEAEKEVFLSQISTLQGQQSVLGARLESLTQAADNAMEREREAENRLDVALNQHARQISQRQARESELERTVQELNAALVVSSRGKDENHTPGKPGNSNTLLEARISALEVDLQAANSQLVMEREQRDTLQTHLRSFSNETTQEATMAHAKQIQYDRQIADMSLTISKLETQVREYEKLSPSDSDPSVFSSKDDEMPNRIKMLSEEVVRLRDKIASHNSESLAMKNRLKGATDRANKLEDELSRAKASPGYGGGDVYDSMERAQGMSSNGRRKRTGAPPSGSIRTAMLLNSSRGDRTEKIGRVVDQIDSFAASTGKYLKRNPLARAGFIFYLILIHTWTFVLLFFHAHSFDTMPNGNFGPGFGVAHGPHSLVQQSIQKADLNTNADPSVAIPKLKSPT